MTVRYSVTDKDVPIHERSCYELNQSITMSSENNAMSSITFRFEVDASGKMYTMSQIEIAINYTKGFTFSSGNVRWKVRQKFYNFFTLFQPVERKNSSIDCRALTKYRLVCQAIV